MVSVTQKITEIVKNQVENLGYEFVDLNYGKRGKTWYLQIFVDKENGIKIDDCAKISQELGYELDRHPDLLTHTYQLEVSSPGLDRLLKTENDFIKYKGRNIKIKLYNPLENYRMWQGRIIDFREGKLVFEDKEGKQRAVELDNIASANLEVKI